MTESSAENSFKPLLTEQMGRGETEDELWFNTTIRDEFTVLSEEYSLIINKLIITLNLTPN